MDLKRGLTKLIAEEKTIVETLKDSTLEPRDINKILGLTLFLAFILSIDVNHAIMESHLHFWVISFVFVDNHLRGTRMVSFDKILAKVWSEQQQAPSAPSVPKSMIEPSLALTTPTIEVPPD